MRFVFVILVLVSIASFGFSQNDNTSGVYGKPCGKIGVDPEFRTQLELFINEKNTKKLNNWLFSNNNIKKVYAAEGFIRLSNNKEIKLKRKQCKSIEVLKISEELIKACQGCIYSEQTISKALQPFDLQK